VQRLSRGGRALKFAVAVLGLLGTLAGALCAMVALAALAELGGCASSGPAAAAAAPVPAAVPQLRLAPALLGRSLALQQHIDVRAPGHAQALDVMLEADPRHVRLAVLALGQVAARLDWDGVTLDESRVSWWPPQVSGARILADLQLAEWPLAAVQGALPPGWSAAEQDGVRMLRHGDEIVTTVTHRAPDLVEIAQRRAPYTLTIASRPLEPAPEDDAAGAAGAQEAR
jgi:hypothetical protein